MLSGGNEKIKVSGDDAPLNILLIYSFPTLFVFFSASQHKLYAPIILF